MTIARPRRSALYLPASNARAIEKARTLDADVVILDLEDAVAPEMKAQARAQAVTAAREGGFGDRELVIRVNAIDTPWGSDDLAAVANAGADAVLAPKVSSADDVAAYRSRLSQVPLWVMIETCASLFRLDQIAAAGPECLVMGTNDLAKEMRAPLTPERTAFHPALAMTVAAARSAGIAVLDGVCNAIEDPQVVGAACAQGVEFGFDGKTLIHPAQIEACNAAFSPSPEALAHARAVVAAFADPANAGKGAIRVEGGMAERLHLAEAERLIAVAAAIASR
ncbi:HpcH/HpaI aldolase/citrate lyase family protein [Sphingomonas cavernae]|uniref:CoA ester lyase n=1 Tax=Sphingomonas cavernae TaxID=2320861 RepID=A0A418WLR1_9SPHN|nr:CoA ester lyase [Sphingomonas cavernae]RJF90957.1 CoA ester lyase [Sphingomonas cavernae]